MANQYADEFIREELAKRIDLTEANVRVDFKWAGGVIADKDRDRIIKKLQADIEKYKAGSDDDTALITSQLKVDKLSVNQELTDDEKEEISTSKEQAEASDGHPVAIEKNKEKQRFLPNQTTTVHQEATRKENRMIMYTVRNDTAKRPDNYNIQESCKEVIKSLKCMHILHTLLFTLRTIFM